MSTPREISVGGDRLAFGMVPMHESDAIRASLGDFCRRLGEATGLSIVPHVAPSPAALAGAIQQGRVELAWLSPTLLVTSPHVATVLPLASTVRGGEASYHAALFVDEDGPIRALAELRGARAAWVAPTSAAGYLFPRISLARKGLDPRSLFSSESFIESHGGVALAVFAGRADVGATFAVFERGDPSRGLVRAGWHDVLPGRRARVLDVAGPIPSDVMVAARTLTPQVRGRLAAALPHLASDDSGRSLILRLFNAEGFRPFSTDALQSLRALVAAGRSFGL